MKGTRWFLRLPSVLALAAGPLIAGPASAAPKDPSQYARLLDFPITLTTASSRNSDAFAWTIRQGDRTKVMFARGPAFQPLTIHERTDHDGQPVTAVALSADGAFVAFLTGVGYIEGQAHNPAGLIDPPATTVWIAATQSNAPPRKIGKGTGPEFLRTRLIYRQGRDLRSVELSADAANDQLLLAGGAAFGDVQLSPDSTAIAFTHDRGGYAFVGVYRFGADRINWVVSGPDRAASPVWSPDGTQLAYVTRPGREHDKVYDRTESEPLSVHVVDVRTAETRTLWQSQGVAAMELMEDPDSALRWMGNDRLVFLSEHDGWARLYTIAAAGGSPTAITPPNCEVAESEQIDAFELFVIHNCTDRHLRQASIIDLRNGKTAAVATADKVLANAVAGANGFVAFSGGDANAAPLMRVLQTSNRRVALAEKPADHGYAGTTDRAPPAIVLLRAEDGVEVAAQLFMPTGKGPHPAVIYVHGGPQRQMFPAYHFSEYYARNYAFNRELARLGYVVLSVNFRSGVGYGRAFREAADRGWRGASEYRDVLAAARWLAERDDVDRAKIGIWGGSYGGLLTAQALARNSDLFAAGVSVHGVYDWGWPSAKQGHLNPSRFFGVSDDDRKRAFEASPLSRVDQWKSPVLLFSGDADMNVDVLETVDLAQKLRANGVAVETTLVPGEPHGFIRNEAWFRLWKEMSAFFGERLKP
ncbi:dipeptidyl aminopeptidase/acylaminoacyl peptidase [Povalibacter uvarum]|uniref:Acyl-peptide hydrolase n=1 Tax=Povalibacter uvarum TaxID=732238 RepID=A0A841HX84_9GAMM|nr:alpha/beta fold hydrolase [Povalibacter uvarum]MBB6096518.1 dipeptidyl aminopeptidase/acylaminoacyl peptidase [Povalibacter uvarum]